MAPVNFGSLFQRDFSLSWSERQGGESNSAMALGGYTIHMAVGKKPRLPVPSQRRMQLLKQPGFIS